MAEKEPKSPVDSKVTSPEIKVTETEPAPEEEERDEAAETLCLAFAGDSVDTSALSSLAGRLFAGRFRLEQMIGHGGMSVVYKATDLSLQRPLAIKLLKPDRLASREAVMRFQREARAASKLDSPHIVRIHQFDLSEGTTPFIVMDFVDGHSLAEILQRRGKISPSECIEIMLQVTSALLDAHKMGVVHRDLKPGNIMIVTTSDGKKMAKIVDFGIAKLQSDEMSDLKLTQTGEVFGSPLYMSPEQCLGGKVDGRSDIYSLGCVMYELLTGQAPFIGQNAAEAIVKHVNEKAKPFPAASGLLKGLESVVMKMLEKKPEDRYQSFAAVRDDLDRLRQGGSVRRQRGRSYWLKVSVFAMVMVTGACFFGVREALQAEPAKSADFVRRINLPTWAIQLLMDDQMAQAVTAYKIADSLYRQGKYAEAESQFRGIGESNPKFVNLVAFPIAKTQARQRHFDQAQATLKHLGGGANQNTARLLHGLGYEIDAIDGDYRTARTLFERARDLYFASKNEHEAGKDIFNVATCDERDGELQKAAAGYRQASDILARCGNGVWAQSAQNRLSEVESKLRAGGAKKNR